MMVNENQGLDYNNSGVSHAVGILAGVLIGCVAGAAAMLLLAPQSGRDTRMQIRQKGIELRDRTAGMMDEAVQQVRQKTDQITMGGRQNAEDLKQQGQELVAEQLGGIAAAAQAGKKAVQSS